MKFFLSKSLKQKIWFLNKFVGNSSLYIQATYTIDDENYIQKHCST